MFRKNVTAAGSAQLSGKDAKKLLRDAEAAFPGLGGGALRDLIPSKGDVTAVRLSNRAVAYVVDGDPLLFDPDGRGERLLPTVYALWRHPRLAGAPLLTYSEVSPKVLAGADLYLQGARRRCAPPAPAGRRSARAPMRAGHACAAEHAGRAAAGRACAHACRARTQSEPIHARAM